MVKVTRAQRSNGIAAARVVREGLLRRARRAASARPTRSSRAPTRSSRSSITPTRTPATPRPRRSSRRSRPRTTCSATPPSASRVRRGAPHGRVGRRSRRLRRLRSPADGGSFTFEGDLGDLGGMFGNLFGGGAAAGGRRRAGERPATRQDLETELHLSFDDAVHGRDVDRALPRRRDVLDVRGLGRGARHHARDVPAVSRLRFDRGRPGSVLVLGGVPDVWWSRPGDPEAVPDVQAAAGSRCAPAK